ncbi:MAG: hypothetical protein FWG91_10445 [Lachnospiraceae bacterium]|nr:hypothetical protein [Lachnospiraceae bacterium]
MSKSNSRYMTEIQGGTLVDIVFRNKSGEMQIEKINANFTIDLKKDKFEICPDDTLLKAFIMHYYYNPCVLSVSLVREFKHYSYEFEYIHGLDNNDIPFTLLDCSVYPSDKRINIVWNNIIIGQHIKDEDTYFVDRMKGEVNYTKGNFSYNIKKNTYDIASGSITVNTYSKEKKDFFELVSTSPISLKEMKDCFNSLLKMYSLFVGYIPIIIEMRFFCGEPTEFVYATYHDILFSSNSKGGNGKCLHLLDSQNFSAAYEKFTQKNPIVFKMFRNALDGRDLMMESKAVILIQCLEGYFSTHHEKELLKPEFVKKGGAKNAEPKKILIETIENALKESKEINDLFGKKCEEIINNVKTILGNIHKMSLKQKLEFAINHTEYTKKIFARETKDKFLDEFLQKSCNTRNLMSHLYKSDKYFTPRKTKLAIKKYELLFRLCFLHDIGLEINEGSLDNCISVIEREFYENPKNVDNKKAE